MHCFSPRNINFIFYGIFIHKSLRLPSSLRRCQDGDNKGKSITGFIVSLLSTDQSMLRDGPLRVVSVVFCVLQFLILTWGIWAKVGPAAVGGALFVVLTSVQSGETC